MKKRISTASAKAKGRSFQQSIRDVFRTVASLYVEDLRNEDIESRQMGGAGEDVRFLTAETRKLFPFYVECKQAKTGFNPHILFSRLIELGNTFKCQALLFHRRDRHETLVTMELGTFKRFLEIYCKNQFRRYQYIPQEIKEVEIDQ